MNEDLASLDYWENAYFQHHFGCNKKHLSLFVKKTKKGKFFILK